MISLTEFIIYQKQKKKNSTQSKTSIPGLSICIKKDASNIAFERLGI